MAESAKEQRRGERWNESEIRRIKKRFDSRPSMPYRIENPGHDDFVYSEPPPPAASPVDTEAPPKPSKKRSSNQGSAGRDRTLAGLGSPEPPTTITKRPGTRGE